MRCCIITTLVVGLLLVFVSFWTQIVTVSSATTICFLPKVFGSAFCTKVGPDFTNEDVINTFAASFQSPYKNCDECPEYRMKTYKYSIGGENYTDYCLPVPAQYETLIPGSLSSPLLFFYAALTLATIGVWTWSTFELGQVGAENAEILLMGKSYIEDQSRILQQEITENHAHALDELRRSLELRCDKLEQEVERSDAARQMAANVRVLRPRRVRLSRK
eukprot:TRINITY_DN2017_c0_g2_i1.p1 TRINITY_DN2017_c0_g2~~TRINITY_DN2017_c0_g2_i1.p1  ORF type:complete len:219 (+),score=9.95 TRINITY_DN2017_c0_g2_i1:86-742(+)